MIQSKLSLAILLSFIALVCIRCNSKSQEKQPQEKQPSSEARTASVPVAKTAYVAPPLEGVNIPKVVYEVKAENGGNYKHKTGTVIEIPKDAFLDENGKVVKGKVDLSYREFRDPVDFFVSGIPMTYKKNGKEYTFESAGMCKIEASQNGKKIRVNPANKISVKIFSKNADSNFNRYVLDTVNKKWVEEGQAEVTQPIIKKDIKQVALVRPELPVQPIKPLHAKPQDPTLIVDVVRGDFPEMDVYKGVEFRVEKALDKELSEGKKINWEGVKVEGTKTRGMYKIIFTKGEEKAAYLVRPAFKGAAYDEAIVVYEKKFADYKQEIKNKQEALRRYKEALKKADARREVQSRVSRTLRINAFGYYNLDRVVEGELMVVEINLQDEDGNPVNAQVANVVCTGINGIFSVPKGLKAKIMKKGGHFVWCITEDGKLGYLLAEDLKKQGLVAGVNTLKVKIHPEKITSPEQVRKLLKLARS